MEACQLIEELQDMPTQASDSHLDLGRAPYVLYGVKYIDLVSLDVPTQARVLFDA